MTSPFVLASRSPRRVAFLRDAGYSFQALPADVPEIPGDGEGVADYALRVALAKARAAQAHHPALPVLGADTDVALHGRILGKPGDAAAAIDLLLRLSGQCHEVISAIALVQGDRCETCHTITTIEFTVITPAQAQAYVATGEPLDKAGAYAIQGGAARFVRAVHGSYTGVVGLPLAETCELLARWGIHPSLARPAPTGAGDSLPSAA